MKSNQKMGQPGDANFKFIQTRVDTDTYKRLRLLAFVMTDGDLGLLLVKACDEYLKKHWHKVKDLL